MKKIVLAGVAIAFFCAPASAEPAPAFNWTGFYLGVNGGALSNNIDGDFATFAPHSFDPPGISVGTGGLHGGIQGQWENFVAGIEGGFNAVLSEKFGSRPPFGGPPCQYGAHTCDGRLDDLLTVGGRLGVAFNNWLLYGAGGYARGSVELRGGDFAGGGTQDKTRLFHTGWYAGGGFEYAVFKNLTIGIDWKHFDLNRRSHFDPANNLIDVSAKGDAVTARLTIKGGG
jgi:outer membrane immunogenic protein